VSDVAAADLTVGAELPERRVPALTPAEYVRWVGVLNDVDSAVHYDSDAARAAGHPSVFAPGMLTASVLVDYATDLLGAANVRYCRVRFMAIVFPEDELICRGRVVALEDDGPEPRADLELECARAGDDVAVRAWMTFAVPR
jgi:acyl dehydratase